MSSMSTTERADLVRDLADAIADIGKLGDWIENATTSATDDEYEVDVRIEEYENYVDLGEFGEQTQYVTVETTTTAAVEIEVDIARLVSDESPVYSYYLSDEAVPVLEQALEALRSFSGDDDMPLLFAGAGSPETEYEARAARAAMCVVTEVLGPLDSSGIGRALAGAFRLAMDPAGPVASADLEAVGGYDPLTVDLGLETTTTVAELRLGDDVTGSGFGRVVKVARVDASEPDQVTSRFLVTTNRDGIESTREVRGEKAYYIRPISPPSGSRLDVRPARLLS